MLTTPRTLPNRTLYTPASACEATVYSSDDPCGRHAGWSSCSRHPALCQIVRYTRLRRPAKPPCIVVTTLAVVMRGGRHAGWSSCGGRHFLQKFDAHHTRTRAPSLFTSSLHKCYTTYIDIYRTLVSKRISLAARGALSAER